MSDSESLTASPVNTRSSVIGHTPPFASVAAITDADSAVASTEQSYKERGKVMLKAPLRVEPVILFTQHSQSA